jgi:asparagine synthase (glutamine-hydrolysing)
VCGIVGNVMAGADRRPDPDVLRRMADRIRHRGPDEEGFVVRGPAGLGMRRLRIIDLETGRQPMTGEDASTWVVFNGEIYNYRALTRRLTAAGHRFTTASDTETIVHAWESQGVGMLDDLEGMFALAVWDERSGSLFLARDRLGIKPLYYAALPDQLVFASELKALVEHPDVSRQIDPVALSEYLAYEYVPAPRAIFQQVRKLAAGHWLVYQDGRVKIEPYWDVAGLCPRDVSEREAVEGLRELLDTAVRDHMVSDVPLGVFLSGGIDSSAVAAFAAPHARGRLSTFSIAFDDPSFDESGPARQVAAALGTDHHEQVFSLQEASGLIATLPDLLDEPLGDASLLPTYLLSRFARRAVTVALSGDGGDEVFAGYPTYQAHRLAGLYARVPSIIREGVVAPLVRRLPVSHDNFSLDFRLKRFVAGMPYGVAERHARWMGSFTPAEQNDLLTPDALSRMPVPPSYAALHALAAAIPGEPWLNQVLYLDLKGYLSEGVLTKVDRVSMACSLEVRVPLLDRRVVEFAATLPPGLRLRGLTTKYVLKRVLRGRLPDTIITRPKKGFGIPLARWFRGELGSLLQEACAPEVVRREGFFRPEAVLRLVREHREGRQDHRKKLYTILAWQLWAARYRPL